MNVDRDYENGILTTFSWKKPLNSQSNSTNINPVLVTKFVIDFENVVKTEILRY